MFKDGFLRKGPASYVECIQEIIVIFSEVLEQEDIVRGKNNVTLRCFLRIHKGSCYKMNPGATGTLKAKYTD